MNALNFFLSLLVFLICMPDVYKKLFINTRPECVCVGRTQIKGSN